MIRALISCFIGCAVVASSTFAADRQPLRVQYVASGNDARTADFKKFLEQEFATVSVTTGPEFDPKKAAFDVVIIDTRLPKVLPSDFAKPILLLGSNARGSEGIGNNGVWTASVAGSKFDWLCLCLDNKAYDVDTKHAIFQSPYPVTPTLKQETNPYTKRSIDAWLVHEKLSNAPGLVSSADHFRGAADSEIISGGLNMKGDRGVCLVREGHTFFWGFAGTPSQMTGEARKVFVNAVVYIKKFDGHKQTVRRGVHTRSILPEIFGNASFFKSQFNRERYFASDATAKFGAEHKNYSDYYKPNLDYIYVPADHSGLKVDEEAKQLGIPNNDIRLLDRCVALLESKENEVLAKTLLERYTGESFATAQEWRAWLTRSRDKLFFLDSYGYRFFTDAPNLPPAKWQVDETLATLKLDEPNNTTPVTTGTTLVGRYARNGVTNANVGDVITVAVRMKVAEPWHTYAKVPGDSATKATVLDVKLPEGLRFVGEWKNPNAKASNTPGTTVYEGDLLFTRDVLVTKAGSFDVSGSLQFQACDPERCQPPHSEPISLKLSVSAR
jgi:hypothetical protein